MMRAVQLTPDLLCLLQLRPLDRRYAEWLTQPAMIELACLPDRSWGLIDGGYVMGAAGVMEFWPGRGMVWMLVSARATWRHFGQGARLTRERLDRLQTPRDLGGGGFRRLEATTQADWAPGNAYLKALGFAREDRDGLRAYDMYGLTHALYARVRGAAVEAIALPPSAFALAEEEAGAEVAA